MADQWLAQAAEHLAVAGLTEDEKTALLDLARDVAHNTERRYAPLTCFLIGLAAAGDRGAVRRLSDELAAMATAEG